MLKHDLRLYTKEVLSRITHIDPNKKIRILQCDPSLYGIINSNKTPEEKLELVRKQYIPQLKEKQKEAFMRLKEQGIINKNQGFKLSKFMVQGLIATSRELREELENDPQKMEQFIKTAKAYINTFAASMGVDVIYIVVHNDESTINIHFAVSNLRSREPSPPSFIPPELREKLKKGHGKTIASTLKPKLHEKNLQEYQLTYSTLVDFTYLFFSRYLDPLIERGITKEEHIQRGDHWTTYTHVNPHQLGFYKQFQGKNDLNRSR